MPLGGFSGAGGDDILHKIDQIIVFIHGIVGWADFVRFTAFEPTMSRTYITSISSSSQSILLTKNLLIRQMSTMFVFDFVAKKSIISNFRWVEDRGMNIHVIYFAINVNGEL